MTRTEPFYRMIWSDKNLDPGEEFKISVCAYEVNENDGTFLIARDEITLCIKKQIYLSGIPKLFWHISKFISITTTTIKTLNFSLFFP